MENDVLALFTTKSAQACLDVGGTQSWALNPENAKKCRYAVLFRNPDSDWGGKELHHTAFMIGRISPVVPSTEKPGRWMLTFDEYAQTRGLEGLVGFHPLGSFSGGNNSFS